MTEDVLFRELLLRHGARPDLKLFRNHVGAAWHGKVIDHVHDGRTMFVPAGTLLLLGARQIRAGLAPGSADVIGIKEIDRVGRFVSIELKGEGRRTQENQVHWAGMVRSLGGIHAEVRTLAEADAVLGAPW